MKTKILKLLGTIVIAFVIFASFTGTVKADETESFTISVGRDNPSYKDIYIIDTNGTITKDGENASLPEGISWNGSVFALNNYNGTYIDISAKQQSENFDISLVGDNSLTGSFQFLDNTALTISNVMHPAIGGTGTLSVNIEREGKIVAVYGGGNQNGSLIVKDSATLKVKVKSDGSAYAFSTWFLTINDSANVYADVYSKTENANIYSNGGLQMNSTGNCVFKTNGEYVHGGWNYSIGNKGSLTCYKTGTSRSDFTGGRDLSATNGYQLNNYVIRGNGDNKNVLSCVLSVQHTEKDASAINPTVLVLPFNQPVSDKKITRFFEVKDASDNIEYVGDVKWYLVKDDTKTLVDDADVFSTYSTYEAVVTLATMPGYTFNDLGANAFSHATASECLFDNGNNTVALKFPQTGESTLPKIGTEFEIVYPVAGQTTSVGEISGTGYTGTVSYKNATYNQTGEALFQYSCYYEATVNLVVDDEYTVSGLTSSSFTIKDLDSDKYTVEYTPGSKTIKFIFSEPTEFKYEVYIGNTKYTLPKDSDSLPAGLSFNYSGITSRFTLNNYNGEAIVSNVPYAPLNLYLTGKNTINSTVFDSTILNLGTITAGIGTYNGSLSIDGDDNSSLDINLMIDNSCNANKYGICTNYASITVGKPDVNITVTGKNTQNHYVYGITAYAPSSVNISDKGSIYILMDVENSSSYEVAALEGTPNVTGSGSVYLNVVKDGNTYQSSYNGIVGDSETHNAIGYISNRNFKKQAGVYNKNVQYLRFALDKDFYCYTGKSIEPVVSIPGLVKDTDYSVSYDNNIELGTGTVTVTGIGRFNGTKEIEFEIVDKEELLKTNTTISLAKSSFTYNGEAFEPAIKSITYKVGKASKKLIKDVDYTISYKNNINAGTGSVIITGINHYLGELKADFTIVKAANNINTTSCPSTVYIDKTDRKILVSVNEDAALSYRIKETKNALIVEDGDDYLIHALKPGTVNLTISAAETANYKATTKTIKVAVKNPVNVNTSKVTTVGTAIWNNGSAVYPSVTVKNGKVTYTKDTDYKVTYELINTNGADDGYGVGDHIRVTVDATDKSLLECKNSLVKEVEIVKAEQTAEASIPSVIYCGTGKEPVQIVLTGIPVSSGDSTPIITYTSSNKSNASVDADGKVTPLKAGKTTVTVNIAETEHYKAKTIKLTVNVKKAVEITEKMIAVKAAYNNGNNVIPVVTVKGFTEGTDYTVDYNSVTDAGSQITVTVTAIKASGGLLNSASKKVAVTKADQSITITNQPGTISVGEKVTVTVEGIQEDPAYTVTSNGYTRISNSGSGNYEISGIKKGTSTITVNVPATANYNAKKITFKVKVVK